MLTLCLMFWGITTLFSKQGSHIAFPQTMYEGSIFASSLLHLFYYNHLFLWVWSGIDVLICSPLMPHSHFFALNHATSFLKIPYNTNILGTKVNPCLSWFNLNLIFCHFPSSILCFIHWAQYRIPFCSFFIFSL